MKFRMRLSKTINPRRWVPLRTLGDAAHFIEDVNRRGLRPTIGVQCGISAMARTAEPV